MEVVLSWKQNKTNPQIPKTMQKTQKQSNSACPRISPPQGETGANSSPSNGCLSISISQASGVSFTVQMYQNSTRCFQFSPVCIGQYITAELLCTLNLCLCCIQSLHTAEDVLSNVTHWQVISSQWKLLWKIKCYFCKIWVTRLLDM